MFTQPHNLKDKHLLHSRYNNFIKGLLQPEMWKLCHYSLTRMSFQLHKSFVRLQNKM